MTRSRLTPFLLFLCLGFANTSTFADDAADLQKIVESRLHLVTGFLNNPAMERSEKDRSLIAIAEEMIDFDLMSTLSLGREGWSLLNPQEQREFVTLYVEHIKLSYLEKLHLYNGGDVRIGAANQTRSNRIEVPSHFITNDGEIEIRYKFYPDANGKWFIYDININGVSIVQTNRAQFSEFLKSSSVQELLAELRSPATP